MVVETFRFVCQAEALPPTVAFVAAQVKVHVGQAARVLQWAIVQSDAQARTLWVEGSVVVS